MPPTITLDTLVGKGYLTAEDTKPLQGVKLIFHTDAVDTSPQMVLVEARMPDGQIQAVLADGSVQQFSRSAWATVQKNVDQHAFTILSKDTDFYQRAIVFGSPPKFIWLRVGNCSTRFIISLLRSRHEIIRQFIASKTESLLVLER